MSIDSGFVIPSPYGFFTLMSTILAFFYIYICLDSSTSPTAHMIEYVIPKRLECEEVIQNKLISTDINCKNINLNTTRFYEILSKRKAFYLYLEELTETFLAPNFHVENRFGDLYTDSVSDVLDRQCFYQGKLLGKEQTSKITLNICGGLVSNIKRAIGPNFPVGETFILTLFRWFLDRFLPARLVIH